ncbi:unnamed protein product [Cuscuta epithymum]|uniref:Integrase catalytic domain-containing protein n=1 Tax=Cuscuta epithymum TaxID=186058 RepID=A0AAV0FB40_9ASTE|nr:unnamed protein product [Cuscuta epithymum]
MSSLKRRCIFVGMSSTINPFILNLKCYTNGGQDNQGQNLFVVTNDVDNNMIFVAMLSEICVVQDDESWWIDTGATRHVCKDSQTFKTLKELKEVSILYMGNDSTVQIQGIGQVELELTYGKKLILNDVYFVPQIRKNLVSGGILNNFGFKLNFEANKFILSKGGVFVGQGFYCNGMFKLSVVNKVVNSVYMVCDSSLWHKRLCHVNYRRLSDMSKVGLIPPFNVNIEKCRTCMLNKITRNSFQNVERKSNMLELVHSDLCYFHSTPSFGNKKYVVTFIDDCTRYCYIYLLFSKDEAMDKFKVFKTEVELQTGKKIKRLRTDKGGEYYEPIFLNPLE